MHSTTPDPDDDLTTLPSPTEFLDDTDAMNLSDDSPQTFTPPARIAARFYHSANNRRKSSAASSRRNSISSTQSHQSTRSYRGGCQSNHVAQHLRRASILENRKARLADKAAHAEQVRLRAAAARATTRTSNAEERALAAQQARERHLAEIVAGCREEVRRAKKVAEDMKQRKAAGERKYRLEMEEKLAEAEKRRQEYMKNQRRPRTTSVPAADKKKHAAEPVRALSEDAAAQRIQKAWRTRQTRNALDSFLNMGLSLDRLHEISFEEVSSLLEEEKLLSATGKVLNIFGLCDADAPAASKAMSTRTFLSAYLILGHPAEVLSKDGDQEQDLITKAKELIISFESALSKLGPSNRYRPAPTQTETVLLAHGAFVTAFSDWKAKDSSALVETMVASFVNLDAIWQSVKDDTSGAVQDDYRQGIRDNQVILLSRLRKLAGPDRANALIKKAILESRRSRAKRKPRGDVRPRPAAETPTPSEAGSEQGSASETAATKLESLREEDQEEPNAISSEPNLSVVSSSSERHGAGDSMGAESLSRLFSPLPPNRVLTHELAIDKDYRIISSPHSRIGDTLNRAICDSMLMGFQRGEGNVWTSAMAENIRAKLLRLLKPNFSMYSLISETLDPDHIQQECQQGVFSYERFFSFMSSVLPKLCAPFRDHQVKALAEELETPADMAGMIEKLFKLLHVIDLLSLDYQNFLLASAAPTLIREATGYEQRMFAQDLASGNITLQNTKRWWSNASVNILTEVDQRDPGRRPTAHKIYCRALVDLAIASTPLKATELPETLQFDRDRLATMRTDSVRITTIGAILLTAKNLLKRDVRSQWKPDASRMWEMLKDGYGDESLPGKILSVLESSHTLPPNTRSQLSSTVTRLLNQANSGRMTDPVMKVLFQRLKSHIFNCISASSSGEKVRAASTASEGLASTGLSEFVSQVGEMVNLMGRIGDVDRSAHGSWYEQIQKEVESAGNEESGASGSQSQPTASP